MSKKYAKSLLLLFPVALGGGILQAAEVTDVVSVVGSMEKADGSLEYANPSTTSVIGNTRIKEEGAKQLDEVTRYEAGFLSQPYGADLDTTDWLKLRGFDASLTLDGTALYKGGYFGWSPDMYGVERIEVIKGANSLIYGSSQSGGLINLVSKRPTKTPMGEIGVVHGNSNKSGGFFDISDNLGGAKNVRFRLTGNYLKQDGQTTDTWQKHYYIAPSVALDLSDRTSLTILTSYQYDKGVPTTSFYPAYGTITDTPYGKISSKTNLGEPGSDYLKRTQLSIGYEFIHYFNEDVSFSSSYRLASEDLDQFAISYFTMNSDRLASRSATIVDGVANAHTFDNRVVYKYNLANFQNTFNVGMDYQNIKVKGNYGFRYDISPIDIFNPVYTGAIRGDVPTYNVFSNQTGLYLQDRAKIYENLIANLGVRYDYAKSNSESFGAKSSYDVSHTTLQGGLMYVIEEVGLMPFASYSTSFRPISGNDGSGNTYKPYEGRQYEVGVKYLPDFIDGEIELSYFDLEEKNGLVTQANSSIQTQAGKQTSKGFELSSSVELLPALDWTIAYSYMKARMSLTDSQTIDSPMIPKNSLASRLTYDFQITNNQSLKVGVGARYVGKTTDEAGNPGVRIPSYLLYDALLQYNFQKWRAQVNVFNIFDKDYVAACYYSCYYGEGMRASLTVSYAW